MIALPLMIALAMSEHETSKIYINGYISSRFDQKVSKKFTIEISNSKSNFIVILFHSYPGPFSITSYDKEGEFTKTLFINNEDSMAYVYLFKPTDKLITIEANEDEFMSFSIFSSSIGCEKDEDYFITSKANQTLIFKTDAAKDSYLKINSKSSKCVLIDTGGTMELSVKLDENRIETYLNQVQYDSYLSDSYSKPLFYTFIMGDLNSNDQIVISYTSNHAYNHIFQTGDPLEKGPGDDDKGKGVIRIDITVAIISGLFLVFILLTIIGLRRMRRLADMPSEDEGQTNDQLSVYEPESNEVIIEKVQYPRKFSSEEEYSLSEESENKVKEETYYPPKDVFNIAKCTTELLEESDQNEIEEDNSSTSWDEENPYNHDAATTF